MGVGVVVAVGVSETVAVGVGSCVADNDGVSSGLGLDPHPVSKIVAMIAR